MLFRAITLLICLFPIIVQAEQNPGRIGYAYDKKTMELLYTENHFEVYDQGLILSSEVIYKNSENIVFATKNADFTTNRFMPEFILNNIETGHKEIARYVEAEYEIIFSKTERDLEEDSRISLPENGISDAGFDNFVIQHWDELLAGQMFQRDFLIPSMMKFIKFRIYQSEIVNENDEVFRQINIEPDSFIVRAFAGTTRLFYDEASPKLRRFDGVSNMRDENGKNYKVIIKYQDNMQNIATN